ncbi:unnamed protein product [Bursaphelenchus okinawaensis]|uniref:Invertebrate defensins family profile domain-containing protein n=1 Tax=Bursaphelenchus okinawaensis TaxID=465554 RepID=A0A811LKY6_9BILA|nr:unnamed protein product [Bursaphelenchus okinawaensis]CAG9123616.1 unnamed protein product [Bursaphelenchus okinawaensis]
MAKTSRMFYVFVMICMVLGVDSLGPDVHRCGYGLLSDMACDIFNCVWRGRYGFNDINNDCECRCYSTSELRDLNTPM